MPETTPSQAITTSPTDLNSTTQGNAPSGSNRPTFFSREITDLSFLDEVPSPGSTDKPSETQGKKETSEKSTAQTEEDPGKILSDILSEQSGQGEASDLAPPNPATSSKDLVTFLRKQIEGGKMATYDDFDDKKQSLDEYLSGLSNKDLEELWDANYSSRDQKSYEQVSKEFYQSLPPELRYAYKYISDGGKDLRSLFQSLGQAEQVKALDAEKPEDQEQIYRQYLTAINFGSHEEIDEEIATWKDLGQLDKKAKQAKPKLDKLSEQQVSRHLEEQETLRQQNEQAAHAYVDNVYKALQPGEINGLKLDRKTQTSLYNGMVNAEYPSITGNPTNLLGHLLEKYQYIEPNYALITEALWLLSDPTGYRTKLQEAGASQHAAKTVRTLKSEESNKLGGHSQQEHTDTSTSTQRKITRPGNIFRR